jgi:hypothetical protein
VYENGYHALSELISKISDELEHQSLGGIQHLSAHLPECQQASKETADFAQASASDYLQV